MAANPGFYRRSSAFIGGSVLVLSTVGAQAQQLYKCVQPNGRVLYQQEPCADATKQSTVRPPDPVAPKSDAEHKAASDRSAKSAELEMGQVIQMMADLSLCASEAPGFDDKHSGAVQDWKSRNGAAVAKFDQDPDARGKAIARMESERSRFAADPNRAALAESCARLASRLGVPAAAAAKR